jgi:hypothetical protein
MNDYAARRFFFACPSDLARASSRAVTPSGPPSAAATFFIDDDGLEGTSSLLEVLAPGAAGQIVTTEIGFALTGHFRRLSAGRVKPFGQ